MSYANDDIRAYQRDKKKLEDEIERLREELSRYMASSAYQDSPLQKYRTENCVLKARLAEAVEPGTDDARFIWEHLQYLVDLDSHQPLMASGLPEIIAKLRGGKDD